MTATPVAHVPRCETSRNTTCQLAEQAENGPQRPLSSSKSSNFRLLDSPLTTSFIARQNPGLLLKECVKDSEPQSQKKPPNLIIRFLKVSQIVRCIWIFGPLYSHANSRDPQFDLGSLKILWLSGRALTAQEERCLLEA